jgi:CRP-like cAMP-binding protein
MAEDVNHSLDGVTLLEPLTPAERLDLARQCRIKRFTDGEHIIDVQSESRDVYFVLAGGVRVVNFSPTGREVTLDDVGPGGFFGELAAIDNGPRSAFVMPQGPGVVTAAMPSAVFLGLLTRKPKLGLEIMRRLARMVRQSTERIMDLSTLGANQRIQAELMRLALHQSSDGRTATISPIPLHADLASRVSTTRETVARVLNDLARDGIVERRKSSLVVCDLHRLSVMVQESRGH